jgi:NAD+ kinase
MSRVALVVHEGREAAVRAAGDIEAMLAAEGAETARAHDGEVPERADLVLSVGGDGTFLRAAHLASLLAAPVLGVKVGRMGFLTEVGPDDAGPLVRAVLAGEARIEERLAVTAEHEGGPAFEPQWALNEVMVEKRARHRIVRLAVWVDGAYVTTFSADGVIVATPTGSTAYSFSARGPIVSPRVRCLLLTPVSPHMLFDRSLVLDAEEELALSIGENQHVLLTIDGRERGVLEPGDMVRCTGGPRPARVVTFGPRDFHQILKAKFGLPDR